MAVDLSDLVESLQRAVSPPGTDLFPDATTSEYEGHLADAFWELVMYGYISGYTEASGVITEDVATPTTDLGREFQQLIVIVAAMNIISMLMVNLNSDFRAKAGPVEFQQSKSASILGRVLDRLQKRFDDLVEGLDDANDGSGTTYYYDTITERTLYNNYPPDYYNGFVGY